MPSTPYTYTSPDDPAREDEGLFGPGSGAGKITALRTFRRQFHHHLGADRDARSAHPRRVQREGPSAVARCQHHPDPAGVDRAVHMMHSLGADASSGSNGTVMTAWPRRSAATRTLNRLALIASSWHGQVHARYRSRHLPLLRNPTGVPDDLARTRAGALQNYGRSPCAPSQQRAICARLVRDAVGTPAPRVDQVTHANERLSRCVITAGCGYRAISAAMHGSPLRHCGACGGCIRIVLRSG